MPPISYDLSTAIPVVVPNPTASVGLKYTTSFDLESKVDPSKENIN